MFSSQCPRPLDETAAILMGHGSGGRLGAQLIESEIVPALRNPILERLDDQALLIVFLVLVAFKPDD